jgi:hypothetical protein
MNYEGKEEYEFDMEPCRTPVGFGTEIWIYWVVISWWSIGERRNKSNEVYEDPSDGKTI